MIVELTLERDKQNNRVMNSVADYQPSDAVKQRTNMVMEDFTNANVLRSKPYAEFNMFALVDRINMDKTSWNQLTGQQSSDPAQSWRSMAYRPIVRNKIIAICAQLVASIMIPQIYAQNDQDEEDRNVAMVMRSIIQWVNDKYNYDRTFVESLIDALVLPCVFIKQEYVEKMREVKEIQPDGTWKVKTVLDDVFSGFRSTVVPCDEMWIADFYTHDIQKQPYLIHRRVVPYAVAKGMYGDIPNFKYVKPGVQMVFSSDQNLFYQAYDQNLFQTNVELVTYYNREADLQLRFANGVLLDDVDQPNPRVDKRYPFSKTGFELIDGGRFFYYKSLCFKTQPDEEVVNTLYRMMIDGTYLQIMPPAVVFSDEVINSQVIVPGLVTTISDANPNAAFQTLNTNNNIASAFSMIQKVEESISESTTAGILQGQADTKRQTTFEISTLEQNSKTMLGLFSKMISFMVKDLGELIVSDILQFATVGQVMNLQNPEEKLKFAKILIPETNVGGVTKSRFIEFDADLPDEMTEDEMMERSIGVMMEEEEKKKNGNNSQILKVNPTLFRKFKFMVSVRPESITPMSDTLKKALNLEEYALAIANPLVDKEAITRDLLLASFDKTKHDPDKYIVKAAPEIAEQANIQEPDFAPPQLSSVLPANQRF